MAPSPFTAIIIGGSVAGLTLAHMFSRAHINYILLEARDSISPQLGAGIVVMPNGGRILDQIGILEPMKQFMTPMRVQYRRKSDGAFVGSADWPKLIEER
jgi:FAD dependent monooxygenase